MVSFPGVRTAFAPLHPRMPTPLVQTYTKGRSQGMVPRDEGSIIPKQVGLKT